MKHEIIEILNKAHFSKKFVDYIENLFPEYFIPLVDQPYQYDFPDNPLVDLSVEERHYNTRHTALEHLFYT